MKKLTLLDLPVETQKDIFKWSQSRSRDLTALSLVSRHFHAIASSQLWRTFDVVFPDDDDPSIDSSLDRLTNGLDTLATSEHKYARHLKRIAMETNSGGDRALRACKQYGYDSSCGKLMNTLFTLAMKDATALDTFHWNVRIEISRPVFTALHKLPALKSLHVRLQQGPSLYQPPRRFPSSQKKPAYLPPPHAPLSSATSSVPSTPPPPYSTQSNDETSVSKQPPEPPTFSGFKSLSELNVLDIDDLSYISEISACVENSSSTLRELKLSLSESLAAKARKPILDEDEDSDDEVVDDLGNPINPPPVPGTGEGTVEKEAKVRAEKSEQDAVLGKIFGVTKPLTIEKNAKPKATDTKVANSDEVTLKGKLKSVEEFPSDLKGPILELTTTARLLMERMNASKDSPDSSNKVAHRNALDVILEAAEKQVRAAAAGTSAESPAERDITVLALIEMAAADTQAISADGLLVNGSDDVDPALTLKGKGKEKATDPILKDNAAEAKGVLDGTSLFGSPSLAAKPSPSAPGQDLKPEDIDVDYPDCETIDPEDEASEEDIGGPSDESDIVETITLKLRNVEELVSPKPNGFIKGPEEPAVKGGLREMETKTLMDHEENERAEIIQDEPKAGPETTTQSIKKYIRSTRKISIEALSLYLIPMRTSVIARALDLTALRCITLLNVGPQAAFWTWMTHIHKTSPLQLKKIHTDNVTKEFLSFVNALDDLSELFLLERSSKAKVPSSAQETTVVTEDIRKLVLQKHTKSLRKLMIKNENDYSWDLSAKVVRLLTKKGKKLKELAICVNMKNFHLLLQNISGFDSLEALHVISCRTDDTCQWVVRELRNFAVDNIAHYPHLRLKYIAVDSAVERVIRHDPDEDKPRKDKNDKGELLSSDSEEDEDELPALRVSTFPTKFHSISGVRIFRKDVRAGTL